MSGKRQPKHGKPSSQPNLPSSNPEENKKKKNWQKLNIGSLSDRPQSNVGTSPWPETRHSQKSDSGEPYQSRFDDRQSGLGQKQQTPRDQQQSYTPRQNPHSAWGQPQQSLKEQQTRSNENVPSETRSQTEIKQSAWGKQQQTPRGGDQSSTPRQNPQSAWGQPQQSPREEQPKSKGNVEPESCSQPEIKQTQQSAWGQPQQSSTPRQIPQSAQAQPQQSPREEQPPKTGQNIPSEPQITPTSQQLSYDQQQPPEGVPMEKKNRNKYPKKSEQSIQQNTGTIPKIQQNAPPKPLQTKELLAEQTSQKLVSTAPIGVRKSKGGFQPLEVTVGSCVGGRGQKLKIEANYLRIQIDRLVPKAYHYDVRFDPEKIPKKNLPDIIEKFRMKCFAKYFIAFDGKNNIYSARPLPIQGNALKHEMAWHDSQTNRERNIIITIKEVDTCVIDLSAIKKYADKTPGIGKPLRAIQCLDIVLRMPFSGKFVNVNRSFFTRPNKMIDLGENYELWTGLYQSVVIGDVPLFNIDVVNKPFPSARNVLNILTDVMNVNVNQPLQQQTQHQLNDYLKGLTLVYKQPGTSFSNVFKYNGLKDVAKTQTFVIENRKLTVEAYFREKNTPIKYPNLPCLWCGPAIKNIYLPLEFCSIQDGQVIRKNLSENQIRTVIAETATSTDVRKRRIMDLLEKIRHNESQVVKEFGIHVGDKFTEVDARILSAPTLEYQSNPEVKVDRGVWNAEREQFLDGKQCRHWSVLKLDDRCPNSDILKLADMIYDIGRKANMSFAPKFTDLIEMRSNSRKQDIEAKMLPLKRKNVELLFVIIPNRNEAYSNVKQAAELKCGILTQCIKSFTLARKLNGSTIYNLLLKLNTKLNGLNHKVPLKFTPPIARGKVMIVGADVTHPTSTMNEPSAVGVAASHDANNLRYSMCWRIQNPTQEIITDLKNIMVEQLHFYKKSMNNELPDKILYYRDGVSDGQFEDVLNVELAAIYLACQQMAPAYKPAVTFIVVQKRHNTRFYPGASRVSCGKNNNVMPGTIVDKFIIDPRQYQFFLVSHAAIQGVAKPTKYCVIWDDSNIKPDELQALTYNLCHVFSRCNRSVSYVAPTYYAHLAAYRGKVYIQNERINMHNLELEFNQRQIREDVSKGHPMFFV